MYMKAIILLMLCLMTVACSSEPGTYERLVHCEKDERTLIIDQTFSESKINAIVEAANEWSSLEPSIKLDLQVSAINNDDYQECTIKVRNMVPSRFADDALATTMRLPSEGKASVALVHISEKVSPFLPYDETYSMTIEGFKLIASHEIAHALGLNHMQVSSHRSIMEPTFSIEAVIGEEEKKALQLLWSE